MKGANAAMTITLTPEAEREVQAEAERQETSPEQVAMQAMIAGLHGRHIPQTLAEITPRNPLSEGMTLREAREKLGAWPGDETDDELLDALKSLD